MSPDIALATWLGAGRLKPGSGTFGTLAALPVGYLIQYVTGIIGLAIAAAVLMWFGTKAATAYGKKSGEVDDQAIVVDEAVGLWIAALPAEGDVTLWLYAFLFFRLFDIVKPWPASYFEKRKKGGLDVMMDDVIAGLYAFLAVASFAASHLISQ